LQLSFLKLLSPPHLRFSNRLPCTVLFSMQRDHNHQPVYRHPRLFHISVSVIPQTAIADYESFYSTSQVKKSNNVGIKCRLTRFFSLFIYFLRANTQRFVIFAVLSNKNDTIYCYFYSHNYLVIFYITDRCCAAGPFATMKMSKSFMLSAFLAQGFCCLIPLFCFGALFRCSIQMPCSDALFRGSNQ